MSILVDLADRGTIRILDLTFVEKRDDGSVVSLRLADLDGDGEIDLAVCPRGCPPDSSVTTISSRSVLCSNPALLGGHSDLRERAGGAVRGRCAAARRSWRAGASRSTSWRRCSAEPVDHRRWRQMKRQGHDGTTRGVARTAAVAGTATAVSNRVSRRQSSRWASRSSSKPLPAGGPLSHEQQSRRRRAMTLTKSSTGWCSAAQNIGRPDRGRVSDTEGNDSHWLTRVDRLQPSGGTR
jgi:hypothetical protein